MPRLLSSYAANKRVEDGLRRKQEQIRLDYIRTTHRHLDETEKLVDDLIHINVRTPSAFELSQPSIGHQLQMSGSQQTIDSSIKEYSSIDRQPMSSGVSPANFRTELATGKTPGHPIIQVRGNEVFYQYQKQRSNWKKVEPTYKTKLLLHRNNTVVKALNNFSARHDDLSEKTSSEDCDFSISSSIRRKKNSIFTDLTRKDSLFSRKGSRRESRHSFLSDGKNPVPRVIELPPQLSPGHTPRMLDGWTIMKWCLWNKKEKPPVWATRRYHEMKQREYQEFMASRKRNVQVHLQQQQEQQQQQQQQQGTVKPKSATARHEKGSKDSLEESDHKQIIPRAKSVPVSRINVTEDEDLDHFPSIDRGVIRPVTSILRTGSSDKNPDAPDEELRPKTTSRRRVALDTAFDDPKDIFRNDLHDNRDEVYLEELKISKPTKNVNYDGRPVSVYTFDTLEETDKESSDEENH